MPEPTKRSAGPAAPVVLPEPDVAPWRPVSARLRLFIVLLTLATVLGLALALLQPQRRLTAAKVARAEAAARAACPPDAASAAPGCPGGKMELLLLPIGPPPATAPR